MPTSEEAEDGPAERPGYDCWRGRGDGGTGGTLLHPPYTAWHLSYAVIGAALAPRVQTSRLIATVLAFFLAVGWPRTPSTSFAACSLRTRIPSGVLVAVVVVGLAVVALGVVGVYWVGWTLIPFMVAGPVLVIAYNAELFGGAMHTDFGFAAAWGAFPVLVGYVAQAWMLAVAPVLAAGGAFALSTAQRLGQARRPGTSAAGRCESEAASPSATAGPCYHRGRPAQAAGGGPADHVMGDISSGRARRHGRGPAYLRF